MSCVVGVLVGEAFFSVGCVMRPPYGGRARLAQITSIEIKRLEWLGLLTMLAKLHSLFCFGPGALYTMFVGPVCT